MDCGYIFEDLVKRFSESFGEEAGAHFTSRDIIYLMTDLLLCDAKLDDGNVTVYDMTMGTSQMLSCMEERIHELNSDVEVTCFGQEFNPSTFAIAKADMMIRGGDPNNMRFGDTLSDDQFPGFTFRYCISNPPFGIDWKREKKAVVDEAAKGELGRFAPGLPKISDGQQLFVLNGLSKLAPGGKMAIIQNGSPLFAGDAGSGPSNIRQYILENDWLDAIVQLSTDQFMNTGISTYIWVLCKDKPAYRCGKVQLIDASHCYEQRRKSIGTKRNDISDHCRELIVQAYGEYRNNAVFGDKSGVYCESKIFGSEEFGYNKIVVERPQRDENGEIDLENINTLDIQRFGSDLAALIRGEKVEVPRFDFTNGKRAPEGRILQLHDDEPVIIEGIHGLNPMLLSPEVDESKIFRIYVSALTTLNLDDHNRIRTTDIRILRRLVRDYMTRNASMEHTLAMWASVRRGEEKWIFPYQENADALFNTTLLYEVSVLKKYVYPLLEEVPPESKYYAMARDLVKFLNYILDADVEDEIPPTSILREFIGGNTYYR